MESSFLGFSILLKYFVFAAKVPCYRTVIKVWKNKGVVKPNNKIITKEPKQDSQQWDEVTYVWG